MIARILLTGDELLRGFVQDANSGYLADALREYGIRVDTIRFVADDFDTIERELRDATDACDVVVVCGGLGPTHDDRTTQAVARVVGAELVLDAAALDVVEARVRAHGRMRSADEVATFAPGNEKQATFPAGAVWVDPLGTAPGYVALADDALVAVLPGPPAELRHAWRGITTTSQFATFTRTATSLHERRVRSWGIPESRAAQLFQSLHVDESQTPVTICARDGELDISVRGIDAMRVDTVADGFVRELGDAVIAVDDHRPIAQLVADELTRCGWMLATCESCTGGMLGAQLTAVAGASAWYAGGLVTYANSAKRTLGGVDAALIEQAGAVSEPVARAMARGGATALGAEVCIAVTGLAGPGGGTADKPVGTVHVAVVTPHTEVHQQLRVPGDRATIRARTCAHALQLVRRVLVDA